MPSICVVATDKLRTHDDESNKVYLEVLNELYMISRQIISIGTQQKMDLKFDKCLMIEFSR